MHRYVLLLALALLWGGCASSPREPMFSASTSGDLVELNILTAPVGLDLDARRGLDGFSMRIFANNKTNPKPVPIRAGSIEILMFDGSLFGHATLPPALRTWTFSADELRSREFTARIGTGYEFLLRWGTNVPTRKLITVGARYTSPEGHILTSSLSSVTVIDTAKRED